MRIALASAVFTLSIAIVLKGEPPPIAQDLPDTSNGYRWQDEAKKLNLDDSSVAQLARDKFLITNECWSQTFQPYFDSPYLLIGSDSLLIAYHVLYEETLSHLEQTNARRLRPFLKATWDELAILT